MCAEFPGGSGSSSADTPAVALRVLLFVSFGEEEETGNCLDKSAANADVRILSRADEVASDSENDSDGGAADATPPAELPLGLTPAGTLFELGLVTPGLTAGWISSVGLADSDDFGLLLVPETDPLEACEYLVACEYSVSASGDCGEPAEKPNDDPDDLDELVDVPDEDVDVPDEAEVSEDPDEVESASATPHPPAIAPPTPNATARPPTRPTNATARTMPPTSMCHVTNQFDVSVSATRHLCAELA